ncbi:MAG: hypothetical protein KGI75_01585 [Rhizobiaceae bacterium]|nr:hypothetical protein [Rhizobiaceae bacterium]
MPDLTVYEWNDYGGTNATALAKTTPADIKSTCENWQPGNAECVSNWLANKEAMQSYTISANCQSGELWSFDGTKYLFDGAVYDDAFWNRIMGYGFLAFKNAATGQRVAMTDAAGGGLLAMQWLTLCPLGTPYALEPASLVHQLAAGQPRQTLSYQGSALLLDEQRGVISFDNPDRSLDGIVQSGNVLFRGWLVREGYISGVAYSYKQGCDPAPYLVDGYDQYRDHYSLQGDAPVRNGCKVEGYRKVTLDLQKGTLPAVVPRQQPETKSTDSGVFDHNGSAVLLEPVAGTISYIRPKPSIAGTVQTGTVLFRGAPFHNKGRLTGTAYLFKRGCAPAPYHVEGGYNSAARAYVLSGNAPIRDRNSCNILGYTASSPNTRLVFKETENANDDVDEYSDE